MFTQVYCCCCCCCYLWKLYSRLLHRISPDFVHRIPSSTRHATTKACSETLGPDDYWWHTGIYEQDVTQWSDYSIFYVLILIVRSSFFSNDNEFSVTRHQTNISMCYCMVITWLGTRIHADVRGALCSLIVESCLKSFWRLTPFLCV